MRIQQIVAVFLDFDDVVVIKVHHFLRMHNDSRNVRSEVEFVLTNTQNKRRSTTGANERTGFALTDNRKAKRTFNQRNSLKHGLFQVALVVAGNQVGHHFGIGFRLEFNPFRLKFSL